MKKLRDATLIINPDYQQFIEELKARVVSARITVARAITHEEILLYWDIGQSIVEKQQFHSWAIPSLKWWQRTCKRHFPECVDFPQTASGECGSFTRNMQPPHFRNSLFQK